MKGQLLFNRVVSLCGVSAVLAPGLVRRALSDGKVSVDAATTDDYRAAMPRLLARLRAYMAEEDAQKRTRRIQALLAAVDSGSVDVDSLDALGSTDDTGAFALPARPETPREPSAVTSLPQWDDVTVHGRRYTADERAHLVGGKASPGEVFPEEKTDAGKNRK